MEIEHILQTFQNTIKQELNKLVLETEKPKLHHNHPPVNYIVNDCPYCKKHGNVFYKN